MASSPCWGGGDALHRRVIFISRAILQPDFSVCTDVTYARIVTSIPCIGVSIESGEGNKTVPNQQNHGTGDGVTPGGGGAAPVNIAGGFIISDAVSAPSNKPAIPALVSVAITPVMNALKATLAISFFLQGAIWVINPTCVPSEPRLPKPHRLYVAIRRDRGLRFM